MRKVKIGDGRLGQGLDGRGEEADDDVPRDPGPVAFGVGTPYAEGLLCVDRLDCVRRKQNQV